MSQPIWIPDPFSASAASPARAAVSRGAVAASLAVVAGTALLGVAAGFLWAALAPRAMLEMVGPGSAVVVNSETSAFIVADVTFCVVTLAGGVVSGAAAALLAVRRWGPLPMAGVLAGAVAAAFIARWIGEQSGLSAYNHLLATLPSGARFRGALTLGAGSALAAWPLAAGVAAGGLTALVTWETGGEPPPEAG